MGRSIVYCSGCGKRLFEEDFASGDAVEAEDIPYCVACAPAQAPSKTGTRVVSSGKIVTPRSGSRRSTTVRLTPSPGRKSNPALIVGVIAGVLVLVILAVLLSGDSGKGPAPAADSGKRVADAPAAKESPPPGKADADPVKATPDATRDSASVEREMREQQKRQAAERLDKFLKDIRGMIDGDRLLQRPEEIERMLDTAEGMAGSRKGDVDALRKRMKDRLFEATLEGHWTFDGDPSEDSSMHGRAARVDGAAKRAGKSGGALQFDGKDDVVVIGHSEDLRFTGDFSIAFWAKVSKPAEDWVRVVGKGGERDREVGVWIEPKSGALLLQQYTNAGQEILHVMTTDGTPVDKWFHVAAVVKGGRGTLYVDGREAATGTRTGEVATGTSSVTFGDAGFHAPLAGFLDDVRIWSRALEPAEIAALVKP